MRKHVCPKCHSTYVFRAIHNDFLEWLMLMLHRRRVYSCLNCYQRFYDRPKSGLHRPEKR